jgi:hypothetical protein
MYSIGFFSRKFKDENFLCSIIVIILTLKCSLVSIRIPYLISVKNAENVFVYQYN